MVRKIVCVIGVLVGSLTGCYQMGPYGTPQIGFQDPTGKAEPVNAHSAPPSKPTAAPAPVPPTPPAPVPSASTKPFQLADAPADPSKPHKLTLADMQEIEAGRGGVPYPSLHSGPPDEQPVDRQSAELNWVGIQNTMTDIVTSQELLNWQKKNHKLRPETIVLREKRLRRLFAEDFCGYRRGFIDDAGQAELNRRSDQLCGQNAPYDPDSGKTLTAECYKVFATRCP